MLPSSDVCIAGAWSTTIMLAQIDPTVASAVSGLTAQSGYFLGCMAGGTIGAALWRDTGKDPGFWMHVGRWLVCVCVGLILTPSILGAVAKFTALGITPNTALLCSGVTSFSGYWFFAYLRERGPSGLVDMAREIFKIIGGKK